MTVMRFGKIDHFLLLGGGQTLYAAMRELLAVRARVQVVASARHVASRIQTAAGECPFGQALDESGVPWITTGDANADPAVLDAITGSTLGLSIGAEWIFRKPFIDRLGGRLVNLHGSRLPRMRGGGGFSWSILMGDRTGGSTIHTVTPGIDEGMIVASREYLFPADCRRPRDFQAVVQRENALLLREFLAGVLAEGEFTLRAQDETISTYWPRLNTLEQGYVDWRWPLVDIERFIAAFDDPYVGASTFIGGQRVHLKRCHSSAVDGRFHPFQAGLIYRRDPSGLHVAAGEGTLVVGAVTDVRGEDLAARLRLGDRFHTPSEELDRALRYRASYRPQKIQP